MTTIPAGGVTRVGDAEYYGGTGTVWDDDPDTGVAIPIGAYNEDDTTDAFATFVATDVGPEEIQLVIHYSVEAIG